MLWPRGRGCRTTTSPAVPRGRSSPRSRQLDARTVGRQDPRPAGLMARDAQPPVRGLRYERLERQYAMAGPVPRETRRLRLTDAKIATKVAGEDAFTRARRGPGRWSSTQEFGEWRVPLPGRTRRRGREAGRRFRPFVRTATPPESGGHGILANTGSPLAHASAGDAHTSHRSKAPRTPLRRAARTGGRPAGPRRPASPARLPRLSPVFSSVSSGWLGAAGGQAFVYT